MDETFDSSEEISDRRLGSRSVADAGQPVQGLRGVLCGHELLMSVVAGYRHSPRCLACLSKLMGGDREEVRDRLYNYIMRRSCRRAAWLWASHEEGATALPACLWPNAGVGEEIQLKATMPESPDCPGPRSDP